MRFTSVAEVTMRSNAVSWAAQVPLNVRFRLQPYAILFEEVVVPLAQQVRRRRVPIAAKTQLRNALESRQRELVGCVQHPQLIHYALLLCCYHAQLQVEREGRNQGRTRRTQLFVKAFHLIQESFAFYE